MNDAIQGLEALIKKGPYIGPKGGRYEDPGHRIPYKQHSAVAPEKAILEATRAAVRAEQAKGTKDKKKKNRIKRMFGLKKGGPYIGPRGGKWADAKHTIAWKEGGVTKPKAAGNAAQTHVDALDSALSPLHDPRNKTKDKNPETKVIVAALNGIIRAERADELRPTDRKALKTEINRHLKAARKHYRNMSQSQYRNSPANPDRQIGAEDITRARLLRDHLARASKFLTREGNRKRKADPKKQAAAAKGRATKAKNKASRYTQEGRARTAGVAEQRRKTSEGLSSKDPLDAWRKKKAEMDKSMDAIDGLEELLEKAKYLKRERKGNRFVYTYADDRRRPKKKGKKLSREKATAMVHRAQADAQARSRKNVQNMVDQVDAIAEVKKLAKPAKKKRAPAKLPQGIAKIRSKGKTSYYGDTSIIQGARKALPDWSVEHMGFGEFYLTGPDGGRIDFHRRDGAGIIQNPSGREHMMTDNAGGKHVRKLVRAYRKLEKKEAAIQAKLPADVANKPEYERADMARKLHDEAAADIGSRKDYAGAIEKVKRARAIMPENDGFYGAELARFEGLQRDAKGEHRVPAEPMGADLGPGFSIKSMDAIDAIEPLAKGEDVTQDLIHGKYAGARMNSADGGFMGKMSKKQKKVHGDVMQYLMSGKMSHEGDVTQKLLGKCNDTKKSYFEPSLKKGMYGFQETPKNAIPDNLLNDYLMAFIEEAYEHEKRECEHMKNKPVDSRGQLEFFAKRIKEELAVCVGNNTELARAAEGVNEEVIAGMLNRSGLIQPQVSEQVPTDAESHEAMNRSWVQDELQKGHKPATLVPKDSAEGLYVDDTVNPVAALQQARASQHKAAYRVTETQFMAKGDGHCPIHGYGDLTKMMNLGHPYGKCTCS